MLFVLCEFVYITTSILRDDNFDPAPADVVHGMFFLSDFMTSLADQSQDHDGDTSMVKWTSRYFSWLNEFNPPMLWGTPPVWPCFWTGSIHCFRRDGQMSQRSTIKKWEDNNSRSSFK